MEKSYSSTRKKLTAAIAMLLIAALMVVTATYAWFTLSTSPEVTGITTTVGANGNLEIALGSSDNWGDPSLITSAVGDSSAVKDVALSNVTWGNIVDLSAADYHLADITLNPARLNILDGIINAASPLKTASYGNDGRVADLVANTVSGIFADGSFKVGGNGVRVLGTASGLTPQQTGYRNAKATISSAVSSANTKAAASLNDNGSKLADIIVQHAVTSPDTNTYDVTFIEAMLTQLTNANTQYETVIRQYFIAAAASALDATEYNAAVNTIKTTAASDLITNGVNGVTIPAEAVNMKAIAGIYTKNATAIATATTALNADGVTKTEATWDQTKAILDPLVDTTKVTVNDIPANQVKDKIDQLASDVMGKGLQVQMPSGSGVYSNFADVGGNYSSSIVISELTYGSVKLTNVNATMTTVCGNNYAAKIEYGDAPAGATGAGTAITDSYGYALDFWFRTNASGSDLLLQEAGQQRVYEDAHNAATMGGGSYMEFESTNANFTTGKVKDLMQAIRIVFTNQDNNVLAYAKLGTAAVTGSKVKAPIELWAATVTADGKITYTGTAKLDSQKITALAANTPTAISVYVYLDGDVVDNGDVANAATSMTGSMNLQFASTAELTPMHNTPLYEGK